MPHPIPTPLLAHPACSNPSGSERPAFPNGTTQNTIFGLAPGRNRIMGKRLGGAGQASRHFMVLRRLPSARDPPQEPPESAGNAASRVHPRPHGNENAPPLHVHPFPSTPISHPPRRVAAPNQACRGPRQPGAGADSWHLDDPYGWRPGCKVGRWPRLGDGEGACVACTAPFLITNTGSDSRLLLTVEELDRTRDTPADCVTASPGQMSQSPPPGRTLSQTHLRLLPLMSRLGDGQAALLAGRVY